MDCKETIQTYKQAPAVISAQVKDISEKATRLVKAEIAHAKAEAVNEVKTAIVPIALFAVAAFLAFFAFAVLLTALISHLAVVLGHIWSAALLVGLVMLVLAGILAFIGLRGLKKLKAKKITTPQDLKADVERIKLATRRRRFAIEA